MNAAATALKVAETAGKAANISPFGPLNTSLISIMLGVLAIILKNQIAHRKMTIQVNGEVRSEFIEEMQALRVEVKGLRAENESLRQEVRGLHSTIDAMRQANRSVQDVVAEQLKGVDTVAIGRALRVLDDKE